MTGSKKVGRINSDVSPACEPHAQDCAIRGLWSGQTDARFARKSMLVEPEPGHTAGRAPPVGKLDKAHRMLVSKIGRTKHIPLLAGSDNPSPDALERAKRFWKKHSDYNRLTTGRTYRYVKYRATEKSPARARSGVGLNWLREFRDYGGDECLLFPFRTQKNPRGTVTLNNNPMFAHRAMCFLAHGNPPGDKPMALHRCGNGHLGCVNPNHLYWGDRHDNGCDASHHSVDGKPEASGPRIKGHAGPAPRPTTCTWRKSGFRASKPAVLQNAGQA
ncbi:MAG: hypothetical protein A49_14150 [Methyloceanibacter sp.]|nr:MAG: hypothetical protein A49_14150 [Methyloceanibacter sp.]